MAGAGYKNFTAGDVLAADDVDTYLQEQTIMVFATAAARDSALTSVKADGMHAYLGDVNRVTVYDGSNWITTQSVNQESWTPTWNNVTVSE